MNDREVLLFSDAGAWEKWLAANHDKSQGVYLAIAKKDSGRASVTHMEALDVALCHGWIDGVRNKLDEVSFLQSFGPRRARSIWSVINRDKVAALIAAGRMRPAGQAEVDRAKADGRWDAAYAGSKTIQVPADLEKALAASPKGKAFFATLSSQNRFAILFRIGNVKKAETRARNVAKFVGMLERGETIYPQGKKAAKAAAGEAEEQEPARRPAAKARSGKQLVAAKAKKPAAKKAPAKKPAAKAKKLLVKKPAAKPPVKKPAAKAKQSPVKKQAVKAKQSPVKKQVVKTNQSPAKKRQVVKAKPGKKPARKR
jgi:uncharacterized protein YdeI (YjbR/CyaY-like superfamily)